MSDALKALDKLIPPPSSKAYQHYQPHYKAIRDKIESMEQEIKALNKCVDSQRRMLQSSQARVAELEAEQPADGEWVSCADRFPEKYRDVPVQFSDGYQGVGRLNYKGFWDKASYQNCKHQYASTDVVRWFDAPQPPKREEEL